MKTNESNTLTFRSILFSYILVCAILLGITGVGYAGLVFGMIHEQERAAGLQVQGLSTRVSGHIKEAYQGLGLLEIEEGVWELAAVEGAYKPQEILKAAGLKSKMAGIADGSGIYRNLYIYFERSDSLLSAYSKRYEGDADLAFFCAQYGLGKEEFDRLMRMEDGEYYIRTGADTMWFLQPVYEGKRILAVLIAECGGNALIGGGEYADAVLLRTQEGDNLLCAGGLSAEETDSFSVEEAPGERPVERVRMMGRPYIGIRADVDLFHFKMYMALPPSLYFGQLWKLLLLLLLELLFMGAVGAAVSWNLSKKMYVPVGNLIRDNRNLNRHVMKNRKIFENLDLIRYLDGTLSVFPQACADTWDARLSDGQRYRMAILSLERPRDGLLPAAEDTEDAKEGTAYLELLLLRSLLEEHVFGEYPGIVVPVLKQYAVIVPAGQDGGRLKELFFHAASVCRERYGIRLCVMLGKEEQGFDGMKQVYDTLSDGMLYLEFWGMRGERGTGVYVYGDMMQEEEEVNYSDYINGSRKLFNCIESEDFRGANRELDALYKKTFPKNRKYLKYNLYRMYGLIGILVTMLHASSDEEEQVLRLMRIQSLQELMKESHAIFEQVIRRREEGTLEKKPEWLEELLEYIKTHYADAELNVSTLADRFGISVPHLSRSFKNWMGMGALEYIHRAKIEKAKEMLKNDCTVKIAASGVGYADVQALTRAFKRYEGITPSQYKEQIRKNEA